MIKTSNRVFWAIIVVGCSCILSNGVQAGLQKVADIQKFKAIEAQTIKAGVIEAKSIRIVGKDGKDKITGFASLEAFIRAGGLDPDNVDGWEDFDTDEFTNFVAKSTRFSSFQELTSEAASERLAAQIFGE